MKSLKTLIVEDDPNIAELNRRCLQQLDNFDICGIASTLQDARVMMDVLKPRLILLDNYLPDGQGIELISDIRNRGQAMDIILVTAAQDMDTLQSAMTGGVFDYVVKPIAYSRLLMSLQRYVNYCTALENEPVANRELIDNLFGHRSPSAHGTPAKFPKGIDEITLSKIRAVINSGGEYTAVQVSEKVSVSLTTARRYLSYCVSTGEISVFIEHGQVGRPERVFSRKTGQGGE